MNLLPGKFYLDDFFDDIVPTVKHNDMKCDIYEKGGEIHVEMDTPGYKKEDIKIDYSDEYLTIEASKENETSNEEKNYGKVFYARVEELGILPNFEIERIDFFENQPSDLTYSEIHQVLEQEVIKLICNLYCGAFCAAVFIEAFI